MPYDALYLSPHLDDAALSCGGQIHAASRRGERVVIVTFHTADAPAELSPLAELLHREWGLGPEAMAVRRDEDEAACETLGAELRHENLLDALYRRDEAGRPYYGEATAIRGRPARSDLQLHGAALRQAMARLPEAKRIYAPLAAGGHVDHRLTRGAAEAVFERRLEYYEDYPYARSRVVLRKALGLAPWTWLAWRSRVVPLVSQDLEVKIRSIACFATQLSTAFEDERDMARQVEAFSRRLDGGPGGGERLWHRR